MRRPFPRPLSLVGQCRFSWESGPAGVEAPAVGSDVALVTEDGRPQAVLGFLDRVPAS
ncbi:MAG TPA: hypothetical protein VGM14_19790 [Streptosporangiaceae bacterium]